MEPNKIVLIFLACLWSFSVCSQKVIFIIVDGVDAHVLEKIETPHLDEVAATGGYTTAYTGGKKNDYSETPTVSAPGYNNLLTGTWGNKHNVRDNHISSPNHNYWSVYRYIEQMAPEKQTAIFSTWLDNRTKLVGEGLATTGELKIDYAFDGFENDTLRFPHDEERLFIHKIDEHVTDEAARFIRESGPDFSWVYLEYTDDIGHKFGHGQEFIEAVKLADGQVGRLWEAVKYRESHFDESWLMFVTTDHGRKAISNGRVHGGQTKKERTTWIVMGNHTPNQYFSRHQNAAVDVLPTILRFMKLEPEKERMYELDGVPLTGEVSLVSMTAKAKNGKLKLRWQALAKGEQLKVMLTTTNNFATGGTDRYTELGQVNSGEGKAKFDISSYPSGFYKIVLEGKHNSLNRWVMVE